MTDAKMSQEYPEPDKELTKFYRALGVLNSHFIARAVRETAMVGTITDEINDIVAHHHEHCPIGTEWDPIRMACIKIEAELPQD